MNTQLLSNRICLLKQEQEKTWKKIEKTRLRAKEILASKEAREHRYTRVKNPNSIPSFNHRSSK